MSKRSAQIAAVAIPKLTPIAEEWRRKAAAGQEISDALIRKAYPAVVAKAASDSGRLYTFTISTDSVDREGDTIAVDGWQFENYLKNPVVLFAHRYDQLPVGQCVALAREGNALKASVDFEPFDTPIVGPLAEAICRMLDRGSLRATSVGFRPIKSSHNEERPGWSMDFEEQELLEFSVVPVPANPEALLETAKGLAGAITAGIDIAPLERALAIAKAATSPAPAAAPEVAPPAPAAATTKETTAAPQPVKKEGRTFSAANAALIKDAHTACDKAVGHLKDLVDQIDEGVDGTEPDTDGDEPGNVQESAEPGYVVTGAELKASMESALSAAVSASMRTLN